MFHFRMKCLSENTISESNRGVGTVGEFVTRFITPSIDRQSLHEDISIGEAHPVWSSTDNSIIDVRKAIVKARILSGTCLLQSNLHRISQYREDPMCKLCKQQEEDIFHVLLYCPLLADVRGVEYKVLRDYVKQTGARCLVKCLHHKREYCPVNN